jgi:hypothetical protein
VIKIDTVYQTVLALANKEQRGYITPQEFNLFADHAQMSIFEQYFYDLNQFKRVPGNQSDYADPIGIIQDKLSIFIDTRDYYGGASYYVLPSDFYRTSIVKLNGVEAEKTSREQGYLMSEGPPLIRPPKSRPIYYLFDSKMVIRPRPSAADSPYTFVYMSYIRKPVKPEWTYVVVNEKPLYNPSGGAVDFELHPSEQNNLVNKILKLAGISIEDAGLVQVSTQEEIKNIRQEKA